MGMHSNIKENFAILDDGSIRRISNELDIAIQTIAQAISHDANIGILVPYKTRKFFYRLYKYVGIPHSKLYIDSLLLTKAPEFLEKAELGKKYLRQWWWISPFITLYGLLLLPIFIPIMIIRMKKIAQQIRNIK